MELNKCKAQARLQGSPDNSKQSRAEVLLCLLLWGTDSQELLSPPKVHHSQTLVTCIILHNTEKHNVVLNGSFFFYEQRLSVVRHHKTPERQQLLVHLLQREDPRLWIPFLTASSLYLAILRSALFLSQFYIRPVWLLCNADRVLRCAVKGRNGAEFTLPSPGGPPGDAERSRSL